MKILITFIMALLIAQAAVGQESSYYLHFSKEKKSHIIKKGKNIYYMLSNDTVWSTGKITAINKDSISVEHYRAPELFDEIGGGMISQTYSINELKALAFKKGTKVVKGTTTIVLATTLTLVTFGTFAKPLQPENSPQLFNKIVNLEQGWDVEIVLAEKKENN